MYQGLNDKFSASASYRAGLSFPLYKGLSISGDLGYQHIEAFDNKDEVIPKRLYALQARANLEYQFTKKFGIFATGGYGVTRFYNKSSNYDKGSYYRSGYCSFSKLIHHRGRRGHRGLLFFIHYRVTQSLMYLESYLSLCFTCRKKKTSVSSASSVVNKFRKRATLSILITNYTFSFIRPVR